MDDKCVIAVSVVVWEGSDKTFVGMHYQFDLMFLEINDHNILEDLPSKIFRNPCLYIYIQKI